MTEVHLVLSTQVSSQSSSTAYIPVRSSVLLSANCAHLLLWSSLCQYELAFHRPLRPDSLSICCHCRWMKAKAQGLPMPCHRGNGQ